MPVSVGVCPGCGARMRADAQRCPGCGRDLRSELVVLVPGVAVEAQPSPVGAGRRGGGSTPVRGARTPRAPRPVGWWSAGLIVVVVVALVLRGPPPDRRARPEQTDNSAVASFEPRLPGVLVAAAEADGAEVLKRVDLPGGAVRDEVLAEVRALPGEAGLGLLARGRQVVVVGGRKAWVVPEPLDARPRPLGAADAAFASADPGRVWLVRFGGDPTSAATEVAEVGIGGDVTGPRFHPLPPGAGVRAGVTGGLVVEHDGRLHLWDGAARALVRTYPAGGVFLAAAGGTIATQVCEPGGCSLRLVDVRSGDPRDVPLAAGTRLDAQAVAFSPDGTQLAVLDRDDTPGVLDGGLVLVDVASARSALVFATLELVDGGRALGWSAAGDTVTFLSDDPAGGRRLVVYGVQGGRDALTVVPVPPGSRSVVAL